MTNFIYKAGKKAGKMKREARAFNDSPPMWAYVVVGLIVLFAIRMVRFL